MKSKRKSRAENDLQMVARDKEDPQVSNPSDNQEEQPILSDPTSQEVPSEEFQVFNLPDNHNQEEQTQEVSSEEPQDMTPESLASETSALTEDFEPRQNISIRIGTVDELKQLLASGQEQIARVELTLVKGFLVDGEVIFSWPGSFADRFTVSSPLTLAFNLHDMSHGDVLIDVQGPFLAVWRTIMESGMIFLVRQGGYNTFRIHKLKFTP